MSGTINVELQFWPIGENQLQTFKTLLDNQLASWRNQYPGINFDRLQIRWVEIQ
jgi:hypothetical protein